MYAMTNYENTKNRLAFDMLIKFGANKYIRDNHGLTIHDYAKKRNVLGLFDWMSECFGSQKKPNSDFRKLLKERIDKANPRRALIAPEEKWLGKLESIVAKLRRGENVQNRQLQTWLSADEFAQIEVFEKGEFRLGRINHL